MGRVACGAQTVLSAHRECRMPVCFAGTDIEDVHRPVVLCSLMDGETEEVLNNSAVIRKFVGIDIGTETVLDNKLC